MAALETLRDVQREIYPETAVKSTLSHGKITKRLTSLEEQNVFNAIFCFLPTDVAT